MSLSLLTSQSTVSVQRTTSAVDVAGGIVNTWTDLYPNIGMRIEDASGEVMTQFLRRQLVVTHAGFTEQRNIGAGMRVVEQVGTLQNAVPSATFTTNFTGAVVDMGPDTSDDSLNFSASQVVTALTSVSQGSLSGKIQESSDGVSGWSDVVGAVFKPVQMVNSQTLRAKRQKRYLRYSGQVGGSTPSVTLSSQINPPRYYLVQGDVENRATGTIEMYAELGLLEQVGLV
jgi:hypothetical protein